MEFKTGYLARLLDAAELSATPTVLSTDRTIDISTLRRQEQRWAGPRPEWFRAVPNKPSPAIRRSANVG